MNTFDLTKDGSYGAGARIKLRFTRAIIDAIHSGALASATTKKDPVFGFDAATLAPGLAALLQA